MEILDYKILRINFEQKDLKYILMLNEMIEKYIKILEKYFKEPKKIKLYVRFNKPPKKIANFMYINLNNNKPYMMQMITYQKTIIRAILKANLKPCYHHMIEHLVIFICDHQMKYPLNECIEDFLKNVYTPNPQLLKREQFYIYEMQVTYLYEKYGESLFEFLNTKETDFSKLTKKAYFYLKEKYLIALEDIKTPRDVLCYILANIKYGWIENGKIEQNISSEILKRYKIPSIESVLKNQIGCCIDTSRVAVYLLRKLGYQADTNLLMKEISGKVQYHAYTIFGKNNTWYCFDLDGNKESSITQVESIEKEFEKRKEEGFIVETLPEDINNEEFSKVVSIIFGTSRILAGK